MIQALGINKKITENQKADQIIEYLCIAAKDSVKDYAALRRKFNSKDKLKCLEKIYDYTQDNFIYYKEPPEKQNVRTAARVNSDKYIDCKGYSTFILSCLNACNIPARYRLASYNFFDKTPTHVYVIATVNGKDYVLDGVIKEFNKEAVYKSSFDVKPKINLMALNYLQGIPDAPVKISGRAERKARRDKRKEKRAEKKEERKEGREERREKRKAIVARIAAAPARLAFLTLTKLNGLKMAKKLANGLKKDREKIMKFWLKFGGKESDLIDAIRKGAKDDSINAVGVAAALATATPILIAVSTLFKELNLFEGKEDETAFDEGVEDGIDQLEADPNISKEFAMVDGSSEVYQVKGKTMSRDIDETNSDTGNTMLYVGLGLAAAVGIYLATRKN